MQDILNKFWAIGGGKGGVGKSIVTIMLGTALAKLGKKVILVDADLGGSNLHTLAGIRYPKYTLVDFLKRTVNSIEDVLTDTPVNNMKMICGADDILGIANPKHVQKLKIFNHIKTLDADVILIDLGAGASFTTIDFFLYAPNKIVILTPQVTSVQNAYGFIKSSLYRKLTTEFKKDSEVMELVERASFSTQGESIDSMAKLYDSIKPINTEYAEKLMDILNSFNVNLVVNMLRDAKEKNIANIVKSVSKNYLGLDMEEFASIQYDKLLGMNINNMASFIKSDQNSPSRYGFYDMAQKIAKLYTVQAMKNPVPPLTGSPFPKPSVGFMSGSN